MSPSIVLFLYSKRTAVARSLVSRFFADGRSNDLWPLLANQPWNYPDLGTLKTMCHRLRKRWDENTPSSKGPHNLPSARG